MCVENPCMYGDKNSFHISDHSGFRIFDAVGLVVIAACSRPSQSWDSQVAVALVLY